MLRPRTARVCVSHCRPRRLTRAVARSFGTQGPLVLLLDLDETLVRAKVKGAHHASRKLAQVDFRVFVDAKEKVELSVSKRPGLDEFFNWIRARRRDGLLAGPWLFTQSHAAVAEAILSRLDPDRDVFDDRVLSRDSCTTVATPGYVLKDLSKIPDHGPDSSVARVVLVDNNAISAVLYPRNTILVRDWLGGEGGDSNIEADKELQRVSGALDAAMAGTESAADNLLSRLAQVTPGQWEDQHGRLAKLRLMLETTMDTPRSVPALRKQMQGVWDEAVDIKRAFLGLEKGER